MSIKHRIGRIVRYYYAYKAPWSLIRKNKKLIKGIKGIHEGERCFIVGNGPSLTPDDLSLIKNEYSFAANKIYYILDKTDWRPTFYAVQDLKVLNDMKKDFLDLAKTCESTFLRLQGYETIREWYKDIPNLIWIPIWNKFWKENRMEFAENPAKYIYDGWTVTYMAMQIAAYMGFKEIYLIGVDHSFPFQKTMDGGFKVVDKNIAAHFYESAADNEKEGVEQHKSNMHEIVTSAYQAAEDYSRNTGKFRIYNATRGGKLEVFERVQLEDIIKK